LLYEFHAFGFSEIPRSIISGIGSISVIHAGYVGGGIFQFGCNGLVLGQTRSKSLIFFSQYFASGLEHMAVFAPAAMRGLSAKQSLNEIQNAYLH
jgi:hypothetical protein